MYKVEISEATSKDLIEIYAITKHDFSGDVIFEKEWDACHLFEWVKAICPHCLIEVIEI